MTTRIPARKSGEGSPKVATDPTFSAAQHQTTAGVIDEAVNSVIKELGVPRDAAEVMKKLMAGDFNSGAAHSYFAGMASAGLQRSHISAARKELILRQALSDDQVTKLGTYAPEYKLLFQGVESHDHPMAAATRRIDSAIIESRIPPGVPHTDVGGSAVHHANMGDLHVHVDQPIMDRKDLARSVQTKYRLMRMAEDATLKNSQRDYAKRYLAADIDIVCDKVAQECTYQSPVITSVHVYDIPMQDWPVIIENKGAKLVEGCLLFSPKMFDSLAGTLDMAGARYEVDSGSKKIRMGFIDSPSWWYEHDWVEYMRYGVDQVLRGKKGVYSYKVIERRGDTLFFRILPVSGAVLPDYTQHYRLPQIEMVEVRGFDVKLSGATSAVPIRRTWLWPKPLWEDMVKHASLMIEKGTLDHERLYNYYRTIAPRQTINAVLVAGGYRVSHKELIPLVTHCAMAAAEQVFLAQASGRYQLNRAVALRSRATEQTVYKLLAAMGASIKSMFGLMCAPLAFFGGLLSSTARDVVAQGALDWRPQPVCRMVNAKLILATSVWGDTLSHYIADGDDFHQMVESQVATDYFDAATKDAALAEVLLGAFPGFIPEPYLKQMESVVSKSKEKTEAEAAGPQPSVEGSIDGSTAVDSTSVSHVLDHLKSKIKDRRDAVLEAMTEIEMEQRKVASACQVAYSTLTLGGVPIERTLRTRQEEFRNPDFWWIECGVVATSVLGAKPEDFSHCAVYTPVPDPDSGMFVRPVMEEEYIGTSLGVDVDREYVTLSDRGYTGWAYVDSSLSVYNGPELLVAMRKSLDFAFDFQVLLEQGPPGCGKTTKVVARATPDSVVMCPVKKSVGETRARLLDKSSAFTPVIRRRVRTLDSYLVNWGSDRFTRGMRADELLGDEVFMSHAGKWYAAAALLGVQRLVVYGDVEQIPHVPRAQAPKLHVRVKADVTNTTWISYRCPADAVAAWGHIYGHKVRSASAVKKSISCVASAKGLRVPSGCVMMGMYQADKKQLRSMYAGCGVKIQIMTVHESEGNTYKDVRLHRFDNRKRTDNFSLYDQQPYALVGMSRHTDSFVYVAPDLGDKIRQYANLSMSSRRVNAAADVETAGESKEMM